MIRGFFIHMRNSDGIVVIVTWTLFDSTNTCPATPATSRAQGSAKPDFSAVVQSRFEKAIGKKKPERGGAEARGWIRVRSDW